MAINHKNQSNLKVKKNKVQKLHPNLPLKNKNKLNLRRMYPKLPK